MYLYAPAVTCFLKFVHYALKVWYHNGDVLVIVVVAVISVCRVPVLVGILVMLPVELQVVLFPLISINYGGCPSTPLSIYHITPLLTSSYCAMPQITDCTVNH